MRKTQTWQINLTDKWDTHFLKTPSHLIPLSSLPRMCLLCDGYESWTCALTLILYASMYGFPLISVEKVLFLLFRELLFLPGPWISLCCSGPCSLGHLSVVLVSSSSSSSPWWALRDLTRCSSDVTWRKPVTCLTSGRCSFSVLWLCPQSPYAAGNGIWGVFAWFFYRGAYLLQGKLPESHDWILLALSRAQVNGSVEWEWWMNSSRKMLIIFVRGAVFKVD